MSNFQYPLPPLEQGRDIASHPLYPVIKWLLEKCEAATEKFGSVNLPVTSIDAEIESTIQRCVGEDGTMTFPDEEIHEMVILTIQVLRIHLLEIERVGDLCLDFSTRYITCLKQKMQSELLSAEFLQESNEDVSNTSGDSMFECFQQQHLKASPDDPSSSTACFNGASFNNSFCDPNVQSQFSSGRISNSSSRRHSLATSTPNSDALDGNSNRKRGVLPKQATQVMRQWLFQHLMHPYPKESEKQVMASQTGLSLLQVNNWFINARRRVLQPIMDRSNPPPASGGDGGNSSGGPKAKQKKTCSSGGGSSNGAVNRFWPEQLRHTQVNAASSDSSSSPTGLPSSSVDSKTQGQQHHRPIVFQPQVLPAHQPQHVVQTPTQFAPMPQHHNLFSHPAFSAFLPGMNFGGLTVGNENQVMPFGLKDERSWMMAAAMGGDLMSLNEPITH